MSHTRRAANGLLPAFGVAAAGVTAGAAGVWAWRRRRTEVPGSDHEVGDKDEAIAQQPQRTGPMVAVYLDEKSVDRLHEHYPGTILGRMRKVVIQYGPSDKERDLYAPDFGGLATVKLTGEAFSADRRALVASVSHAGSPVKPQSLSCAVDVTPGENGGGPLGCAVLIEQVKKAGATKEASWSGTLPPLLAHDRQFTSEEGGYDRLEEPLTLSGSICRADWVDGMTSRCRTLTEGGEKRTDGWTPQGCSICNILEASPCRDAYRRFDSISERISQLQPPKDASTEDSSKDPSLKESQLQPPKDASTEDSSKDPSEERSEASERSSVDDTAASGAQETPVATQDGGPAKPLIDAEMSRGNENTSTAREKSRVREEERPAEGGGGVLVDGQGKEEKLKREELLEKLEREREGIALDMLHCTDYHSVWLDSNADDGLTGAMFEDEDSAEEATEGEDLPSRDGDDVVKSAEETKEKHAEAAGDSGTRNKEDR